MTFIRHFVLPLMVAVFFFFFLKANALFENRVFDEDIIIIIITIFARRNNRPRIKRSMQAGDRPGPGIITAGGENNGRQAAGGEVETLFSTGLRAGVIRDSRATKDFWKLLLSFPPPTPTTTEETLIISRSLTRTHPRPARRRIFISPSPASRGRCYVYIFEGKWITGGDFFFVKLVSDESLVVNFEETKWLCIGEILVSFNAFLLFC